MISYNEQQKYHKLKQECALNEQIEWFITHYAPKDRRDATEFHMYLHSLVRSIYETAQAPFITKPPVVTK